MIRRILKRIKRTSNAYLTYRTAAIDTACVLLEAGQGKNINGNMFALVREIASNPSWANLRPVFVVTKATQDDALARFQFYHIKADIVVRNTKEYCRYLAIAKYLITDNSFPPYFHKREEQVYLNTWHGTPLKTLGKSDIKNAQSLANIQKNYLMCDYALFPNVFTRDVFMYDYMLQHLYQGNVLLCDYPRNSIFLHTKRQAAIRQELGLQKKQLIAYMPTWRGSNRKADAAEQRAIMDGYFAQIDAQLNDDQIFYVNLHFLLGNTMDFSAYQHIQPFPKAYETYDVLSICGMLVTDYSSVFFDYAQNLRKVILFAYDLDDYMHDRGTYFPIQDLPFPIVADVDALIQEINNDAPIENREAFLTTYCHYRNVAAPEMIMKLLVQGETSGLTITDASKQPSNLRMVYGGKLRNPQLNELLLEHLQTQVEEHADQHIVLAFRGKITPRTIAFLERLPQQVDYYAMVTRFEFSIKEQLLAALTMRSHYFSETFNKRLKTAFRMEKERLFYHIEPAHISYFSGNPHYTYKIIDAFTCEKEAHIHHNQVMGLMSVKTSYDVMIRYVRKHYDHVFDHRTQNVRYLWDEHPETYYNKCLRIGNMLNWYSNNQQEMRISALAMIYTSLPIPMEDLRMRVGEHCYHPHIRKGIRFKNYRLTSYTLRIPVADMKEFSIHNKVSICYEDSTGYGLQGSIRYELSQGRKGRDHRGAIKTFPQSETSAYFRQTITNILYFSVRKRNVTDERKEQVKLGLAYVLAKVLPLRHITLLFEKEASRYEESASVLYEKLIDKGVAKVYFIIDRSYPHLDKIPQAYRKHLLYKTSFRHYLYFFKSKTFLSSEAMVHAIDLRIANRYAQRKLARKDTDYVFLQHGVMYMVSLDSESRKFFKPKKTRGKYRVVVSSQKEADHFIDLGGYRSDMIYISGLPKYDRNILHEGADKIVIMPTWRPWEYNDARYDFSLTKYYQMVCRMFHAIPEAYHDRVIILPHPLFYDAVKDADFELKPYLDCTSKYDDILKQTRVLITDYSSIAYDAFYRGSNVIFYWEEKDACMEEYGPTTKLMLNAENVFGDICMNEQDIRNVWETNYNQPQNATYVKRYEELVTYHDGNNTDRLISMLMEDDILHLSKRNYLATCKRIVASCMTLAFRLLAPLIPIDKKTVLFLSFHGRGITDNPRALYLAMREDERFKDYTMVWALRKGHHVDLEGVKIVPYFRPAYFFYLARSRYWIANCKLPEYIVKKRGQVYVQTWHGTPLKRLAHDIIVPEGTTFYRSNMSVEAMRKTYDKDVARYTYMIAPNAFCTEVFQSAFGINRERLIETGYPRNDKLTTFHDQQVLELKQRYHLPLDKKILLYAPTWRDNQFNSAGYTFELKVNFHQWKHYLSEEYVVLFKPHYLITNTYEHDEELVNFVYDIDASADIADLYMIADALVTDYSSVFFDYAIEKRPIYFYMYDIEEYAEELRGFYLDVHQDLPGDIYDDEETMLRAIQHHVFDYERLTRFNERFNHMEDGHASQRVLDIVFAKEGD